MDNNVSVIYKWQIGNRALHTQASISPWLQWDSNLYYSVWSNRNLFYEVYLSNLYDMFEIKSTAKRQRFSVEVDRMVLVGLQNVCKRASNMASRDSNSASNLKHTRQGFLLGMIAEETRRGCYGPLSMYIWMWSLIHLPVCLRVCCFFSVINETCTAVINSPVQTLSYTNLN
jgi:hypothetical protein